MKKTMLATALVIGFSSAAYADSVTLYGLLDVGVGHQRSKVTQGDNRIENRSTGMSNFNGLRHGNRWGLKGSEELGNGTKAVFVLESGFNLSDGKSLQGGRLFGRQAFVGLSSENWGTFSLGRQYTIAVETVGSRGPFNVGYSEAGHLFGAFGASVFARMDNSIKYMSPNLSGFKFGLGYAGDISKDEYDFDGSPKVETKDASHWITAGASYDNGPWSLGASYDRFRTDVETVSAKHKNTVHMWNLFGTYDFDVVKLDIGYGQVRGAVGNQQGAAAAMGASSTGLNNLYTPFTAGMRSDGLRYTETGGYRQQAWTLGVTVPVGEAGKFLASYQGSITKNKDQGFDGAKSNLSIFSLGYEHSLSKRTVVYGVGSLGTGRMKFDDSAANPKAKLRTALLAIGIQHRF